MNPLNDDSSSLVNFDNSFTVTKPETNEQEELLKHLQKEEEESIRKATLSILQDVKYKNLDPSQKAKQISDCIMSLRDQYSKVKSLIAQNHSLY